MKLKPKPQKKRHITLRNLLYHSLKVLKPVSDPIVMKRYYSGSKPLKVIVVGHPRSGTSFVTGLVHRMGYSLGPDIWLLGADKYNRFGYFEARPLMEINMRIMQGLGNISPGLVDRSPDWFQQFKQEQINILQIVEMGGIELYKGNRLMILADLYDDLFPNVKWIFVNRNIDETYRSRFIEQISLDEWKKQAKIRNLLWQQSRPASRAMQVRYEDFFSDLVGTINQIRSYLEISLTAQQFQNCQDFFRPRSKT